MAAIGRYVDLQLLGQGGMGAVYRGRDPELDRPVAIKVMLHATPDFVQRFRREAQSIAGWRTPTSCRCTTSASTATAIRTSSWSSSTARRSTSSCARAAGCPPLEVVRLGQAGGRGARRRASRRHRASRRQAVEPHRRRARARQAGRLRHRAHASRARS